MGYPGSTHDSRVLCNPEVYTKVEEMEILNEPIFTNENNQIWSLIIGDGGYSLVTWLMRPHNFLQNLKV